LLSIGIIFYFLLSTNCFSQSGWIKKTIGYNYDYFYNFHFFNQNTGYVISGYEGVSGYNGRFFKTTNGGQNWSVNTQFSNSDHFYDGYYFDDANFVLVGNRDYGFGIVSIYINNIRNDEFISPLNGAYETALASTDWLNIDTGFIAGYDFGPGGGTPRALKTVNQGANWMEITPPINLVAQVVGQIKFICYDTGYCMGDGKLIKTVNSGVNWFLITGGLDYMYLKMVTKDTFYVCGMSGDVRISADTGHTWNSRPVGYDIRLNSIEFCNSKTGWVCSNSGHIFRTTNAGINWQKQYYDSTIGLYKISILDENNLWVSGNGAVLKTTTGGETFIRNEGNTVINNYKLEQNYPNPFNPVTSIKYQLSKYSNIKLVVYDILGKEIETLVNRKQSPGTYEVNFDAKNLNSGVYFYVLEADNKKIDTKKMLYLK